MDNLIADGKAKDMIIVMPYGNAAAKIAEQMPNGTKPAHPIVKDNEIYVCEYPTAAFFERIKGGKKANTKNLCKAAVPKVF